MALLNEEKDKLHTQKTDLEIRNQEVEQRGNMIQEETLKLKIRQDELETQIKDLHSSTERLTAEREQVEELSKDLDRKQDDTQAAMRLIHEEKQQLQENWTKLQSEREELEVLINELNRKSEETAVSEQHLDKMWTELEMKKHEQGNLEQENKLKQQQLELKQNELETKIKELHSSTEKLQVERQQMEELRKEIDVVTNMINKERQQFYEERRTLETEREHLEAFKEEVNRKEQDAAASKALLNEEKGKLQKQRTDLEVKTQEVEQKSNMIQGETLKLKIKQDELEKQIKDLQSSTERLRAEREQVEDLNKDLDRKKEETQAAMTLIREEKQQLQENWTKLQTERGQIEVPMKEMTSKSEEAVASLSLTDKEKNWSVLEKTKQEEHQQDELKQKEDEQQSKTREQPEVVRTDVDMDSAWAKITEQRHQLTVMKNTLDMDRLKLQKQQEQMDTELSTRQEQLLAVREKLSLLRELLQHKTSSLQQHTQDMDSLRQQLTALQRDTDKMDHCTQLLDKLKNSLKDTLFLFMRQKQQLLLERQHVDKLNTDTKQRRHELDQERDQMDREKEELQQMSNNVQEVMVRSEKLFADLKGHKDMLQKTKSELLKKTEEVDIVTDKTKRENQHMKDIIIDLKSKKDRLYEVIHGITKEQRVSAGTSEESALVRKTQDKVDPFIKKQELSYIKAGLVQEKDTFLAECKQREDNLKKREDELANKMESVELLCTRLKRLAQKNCDVMGKKIAQMEENNDKVLKLCVKMELNCAHLNEEKSRITLYLETLQREIENLSHSSSKIRHVQEETKATMTPKDNATMTEYEPMKPDFGKYVEQFQKQSHELKAAKFVLENTLEELQSNKGDLGSIIDDIKMENICLKQMAAASQSSKEQLKAVKNMLLISGSVEAQELEICEKNQGEEQGPTEPANFDYTLTDKQQKTSAAPELTTSMRKDYVGIDLSRLKALHEKMLNITSKKLQMEINQRQLLNVCTVLEQKLSELNMLKNNLAGYCKGFEMEKSDLENILSTMKAKMGNILELEKHNFKKLKNERTELYSLRQTINKEKEDLEELKSDIQNQNGVLEKIKQDLQNEREEIEIRKAELLNKTEAFQSDMDRMKESIAGEKEMLKNETRQFEVKMSDLKAQEDRLRVAAKSIRDLTAKYTHHFQLDENIRRIEVKNEHVLQISRDIEKKCGELKKLKSKIGRYSQKEKKCDKEIQTEAWEQEQVEKPIESFKTIKQKQHETTQTDNLDMHLVMTKHKSNENNITKIFLEKELEIRQTEEKEWQRKRASLSASLERLSVSTDDKMSKKDYLRQLWKETTKERKEIDQMKQRGQQLKNNLETRIKTINTFVKRPWLQREKETLLREEHNVVEDDTTQYYQKRKSTLLNETLSEIEKHNAQVKPPRALKTSDKANQTSQQDSEAAQVSQGTFSSEGAEAHADPSSGLLCQIQHYCYSCCCHCCLCCQQGCPENNNNNKQTNLS